MRDKLIAAGIRNLKEFGYPQVDALNILTDLIYSQFFKRMLEDTKEGASAELSHACESLISEISQVSKS
jgi:hypothetical protein